MDKSNSIRYCQKAILLISLFIIGWITPLQASQSVKITFRTRALLDAAVSGYGKESVQGYYLLEDLRVGFKASYDRFEVKADVGLEGGKATVKDLILSYRLRHGLLSLGNAYEPFSTDKQVSTVSQSFHQPAASSLAFTNSRKVGITYLFYNNTYYFTTGVYTHNDINKLGDKQKNAFISTTRALWRMQPEKAQSLFHAGGAFSFRTKEKNTTHPPSGSITSDGITTLFKQPLLEATIPDMGTELKGMLELLYITPRFLFQSEYYYNRMNRTGGKKHYQAHGGYIQGGFLIKGREFEYDSQNGIVSRPLTPQAIQVVVRLNYTDMNDAQSHIYGGQETDLSLGLNIYLNKHFGLKVNGAYVWVGEHCNSFYKKDFFLAQTRVQYIF